MAMEREREREIESRRCRSENHVPPLHISPFRNSGLQRFGANCRSRITDPNWLGFSTMEISWNIDIVTRTVGI